LLQHHEVALAWFVLHEHLEPGAERIEQGAAAHGDFLGGEQAHPPHSVDDARALGF
jgi:hypothetical protein